MTEDEARAWLATTFSGNAIGKLEKFVALLRDEAERQSLIARSTFDMIWTRHIADSAQLILLAPRNGDWIDIGSGGGLPGIVVAILRDAPLLMIEPRRRRVDFLDDVIDALGLTNAVAQIGKVQRLASVATVISARAVAPIPEIFAWTQDNVSRETRFIMPRGRSWASELEIARRAWHGTFHVKQSITDPESGIVIADAVTPR